MKVLVISDIHSNIVALEAIWAREQDSDLILCAGDLVDYGPYPREVLDWIRAHGAHCVRGNHDEIVVAAYHAAEHRRSLPAGGLVTGEVPWLERVPATPAEREWRHYNAELLRPGDIAFLEAMPHALRFEIDGDHYGMTHMYRDYEVIAAPYAFQAFVAETFAPGEPITRLIQGHTHRQAVHYLSDSLLWINPGSISYRRPDDPDQTAHYLTLIDGRISLRQVAYDTRPLLEQARRIQLTQAEAAVAATFWGPRDPAQERSRGTKPR